MSNPKTPFSAGEEQMINQATNMSEWGLRDIRKYFGMPPLNSRERICLKCQKSFASKCEGNRTCKSCLGSSDR